MAKRSILVADPDPATSRKVRRALDSTVLGVQHACSLAEAESKLGNDDIAVVLTALSFPDGNAYELARKIRATTSGTPVFILYGGFDVMDPHLARESGVAGGIRRPLSTDSLLAHLESVVGGLDSPVLPTTQQDLPASTPEDLPGSNIEDLTDPFRDASSPRGPQGARTPLVSNERIATFIPNDYESLPHVAVDPTVVNEAMEHAIMAALPEALEILLEKSLRTSSPIRVIIEQALVRTVEKRLPETTRQVLLQMAREGTLKEEKP